MKNLVKRNLGILAVAAVMASTAAYAETSTGGGGLLTSVPASSKTVTDWYKQDVYDTQNNKIGEVKDVLLEQDGQVKALIIAVGGFLGAGEKDVAVNFSAVKESMKNNKNYLTMDTSKDALKAAPGFKYDSDKTAWVPDTSKNNRKD